MSTHTHKKNAPRSVTIAILTVSTTRSLETDESGKWIKPNNILNNWRVTKTCLRLGSKVIGKCMMDSGAADRIVREVVDFAFLGLGPGVGWERVEGGGAPA